MTPDTKKMLPKKAETMKKKMKGCQIGHNKNKHLKALIILKLNLNAKWRCQNPRNI